MQFSAEEFRLGALERLEDARLLRDSQHWVGAAYAAGRCVEAMLRGLIRLKTIEDTSGHDLRDLLKKAAEVNILADVDEDKL